MKISVIVPTYKPQAYLWECLDSIYNQTFPKEDYELIVVLNGCNEPYNSQIKDWMSRHDDLQMRYFYTEQPGVSNARNVAMGNAAGEYVTFIDDDDFVSENYLSGLYEKAAEDTISLCYPYAFDDGNIDGQLNYRITAQYEKLYGKGRMKYARARKFFSGPWMKLIPMGCIDGRLYDIRFNNGEDSLFMFLISDRFKYVELAGRDVVYYRRYRPSSAVTSKRSLSSRVLNALRLMRAYFKIMFSNLGKYSFGFFLTRIMGTARL